MPKKVEAGKKWANEKTCPVCGKDFIMSHADLWTYKIDSRYYCSWTCYRKAQKMKKAAKKRRERKKDDV